MLLAGAAASAAAGAAAPPPEPAVPWLLVGRRVCRAFPPVPGAPLRTYDGIIVAVRTLPKTGTLWRVHYEEDGDREDLSWPELNAALVNEASLGAVGLAPAVTPKTRVVTPTPSAEAHGGLDDVSAGIAVDWCARGNALSEEGQVGRGGDSHPAVRAAGQLPSAEPNVSAQDAQRFKGVVYRPPRGLLTKKNFEAKATCGCKTIYLGRFATAEQAALAYDISVRELGGLVVNFPRPGTAEVQAVRVRRPASKATVLRWADGPSDPNKALAWNTVKHEVRADATSLEHDGKASASIANSARNGAMNTAKYKGVRHYMERDVFGSSSKKGEPGHFYGKFASAEEAAHAYDVEIRKLGRLAVNFPLHGTAEVYAVPGETEYVTLRRAGRFYVDQGRANALLRAGTPRPKMQRAAGAAKHGRAPDAFFTAQPVPVWGSDAVGSALERKRQRTTSPAPEAPLASASKAVPATPAVLQRQAPLLRPAFSSEGAAYAAVITPPAKPAAAAAVASPGNTGDEELSAFLHSISPPLACVDAAVAAARSSRLTMQHVRCAAEKIKRPEFCRTTVEFLGASLGLHSGADHFALMLALQSLS